MNPRIFAINSTSRGILKKFLHFLTQILFLMDFMSTSNHFIKKHTSALAAAFCKRPWMNLTDLAGHLALVTPNSLP